MFKSRKSLQTNAVLNGIKQCCTFIFPLITFPYVSRILGAENYGKVNFSYSIITYIAMIAALGINNYAIREGSFCKVDSDKLTKTVNEIFTLNVISTVVAYVFLFLLLACWGSLRPYTFIILVMSLYVVSVTLGCDWVNSIFEEYSYITARYIICHVISLILTFVFVRSKNDYTIYAFIYISPVLFANILNYYHVRHTLKVRPKIVFSRGVFRHLRPVLLIFGSAVASQIYINSDTTILGVMTSDEVVGYYSVAAKIYTMVKQLFNALMMVAIPRFSYELSIGENERVQKQVNQILSLIILVIIPASVGLFCLSSETVTIVSGIEYIDAAEPLAVLSVSLIFAILACFYINVIMLPYKMENKILFATTISAAVNIILNIFLIPTFGALAAAITTLIAEIIMTICGIVFTRRLFESRVVSSLIAGAVSAAFVLLTCTCAKKLFSSALVILLFSIFVSLFFFGIIVLFTYKDKILDFMKKKR